MGKKWRGSGVRHTIPFVGRFAGLWLIVSVAAVVVAAGSAYMIFAERFEVDKATPFVHALELQTGLTILALVGLAVFTTHRLAGPWIAMRRGCEAVRDGNLAFKLRIRANDVQIKNVERVFNEMMDALNGKPPAAAPPEPTPTPTATPAPQAG